MFSGIKSCNWDFLAVPWLGLCTNSGRRHGSIPGRELRLYTCHTAGPKKLQPKPLLKIDNYIPFGVKDWKSFPLIQYFKSLHLEK